MKPFYHFIASAVLGILFYFLSRNALAGLIVFLAGVFIDLDHLIDFWALKPKNPFSLKEFLDEKTYQTKRKWFFIFLHNWELIAVLWLICYFSDWQVYLLALTLGFTTHLLLDIYNLASKKMSPFSYFLIYRIVKGFQTNTCHSGEPREASPE